MIWSLKRKGTPKMRSFMRYRKRKKNRCILLKSRSEQSRAEAVEERRKIIEEGATNIIN